MPASTIPDIHDEQEHADVAAMLTGSGVSVRMLRLAGLAIVMTALVGCAVKGQGILWRADDIEKSKDPSLRLHFNGETVGYISPARVRMINEVKRTIEELSGVTYADLLVTSPREPNAFAGMRDGLPVVGITLGMIDLIGWDRDAYAAVLGHEYAHLVLKHGTARAGRSEAAVGARQALGIVLSVAGVPMGGTIADLGVTVVETAYSRDDEREADKLGFKYLVKGNFDPYGAVRLWEKMNNATGFSIPFLSTHPMTAERIEDMRKMAANTQAERPAVAAQASTDPIPQDTRNSTPPRIGAMSAIAPPSAGTPSTSVASGIQTFLGLTFLERPQGIVVSAVRQIDPKYRTTLADDDEVIACGVKRASNVTGGYADVRTLEEFGKECLSKYRDNVNSFYRDLGASDAKDTEASKPLLMLKVRRSGQEEYRSIRMAGGN
jgi:hypothetical protein